MKLSPAAVVQIAQTITLGGACIAAVAMVRMSGTMSILATPYSLWVLHLDLLFTSTRLRSTAALGFVFMPLWQLGFYGCAVLVRGRRAPHRRWSSRVRVEAQIMESTNHGGSAALVVARKAISGPRSATPVSGRSSSQTDATSPSAECSASFGR